MLAIDTNVLVYAHRIDCDLHEICREHIKKRAESLEPWAIVWSCLHEFYAVVTNPKIFKNPSTPEQAFSQIRYWTASPSLLLLQETDRHLEILEKLVKKVSTKGGAIHDARIAAICISHGVESLITFDRDFSSFPELETTNILKGK